MIIKKTIPAKHTALVVAETPNTELFKVELKEHQKGKNRLFNIHWNVLGIEKWAVYLDEITCR